MRDEFFDDFVYIDRQKRTPLFSLPRHANFTPIHLTGATIYNGKFRIGLDQNKPLTFDASGLQSFMSASGQYAAILRSERTGEDVITTDTFGYHTVFYYFGEPDDTFRLIASNRFNLVVDALRKEGKEPKLNLAYSAAQICSPHTFYMQNHAHGTAASGVFMLPVDSYLHIGRKVELRKKAIYQPSGEDYAQLLDSGIEQMKQSLSALVCAPDIEQVVTAVTGGKDSRSVFAACLSAGINDRLRCYTEDAPGNPDELRIASNLVEAFGAQWDEGDEREQHPVTLDDALNNWRYHLSNFYNRLNFGTHATLGSSSTLHLTGAAGECYRTFWAATAARHIKDSDTLEDNARAFFDAVTAKDFDTSLRDEAFQSFEAELSGMDGEDIRDKLDAHYLFFRTRGHFGTDYTRTVINYTWHPLSQVQFFKASRLQPYEVRAAGGVMFDIVDRLCPIMNFNEFEAGPYSDSIRSRSPHYQVYNHFNLPDAGIERWQAAQKKRAASLRSVSAPALFTWNEFPQLIQDRVEGASRKLSEYQEGFEPLLECAGVTKAHDGHIRGSMALLAKLYNALDVFEPVTETRHRSRTPIHIER